MAKEESNPGIVESVHVLGVDRNQWSVDHRANIQVSSLEERILYCLFSYPKAC